MVKTFSLVVGTIYLIVGIIGFIPVLLVSPPTPPDLAAEGSFGHLLGLFPVNWLHNVVHIGVGIWGLAAGRRFNPAITFARGLAILYAILALMGLFPVSNTLFGLAPLYGHDIWLHAGTAAIAAYFGWGSPARARPVAG